MELAIGFSKKMYLVTLSSPTQMLRSSVGSLPSIQSLASLALTGEQEGDTADNMYAVLVIVECLRIISGSSKETNN